MKITIVAVHPSLTIVKSATGQSELPTAWFPSPPKVGQEWTLNFEHEATNPEKLDQLNAYLARD